MRGGAGMGFEGGKSGGRKVRWVRGCCAGGWCGAGGSIYGMGGGGEDAFVYVEVDGMSGILLRICVSRGMK